MLFLNSFFYSKLAYNGSNKDEYIYKNILRWTKQNSFFSKGIRDEQNIFDFDAIFIPINTVNKTHWLYSVIGVNINPGIIQICDTSHNTYEYYENIFRYLNQWILDEWKEKVDKNGVPPRQWRLYVDNNYPTQEDIINCGVYHQRN